MISEYTHSEMNNRQILIESLSGIPMLLCFMPALFLFTHTTQLIYLLVLSSPYMLFRYYFFRSGDVSLRVFLPVFVMLNLYIVWLWFFLA